MTERRPRIGLFAEAFGFGPASKVWTVASACHEALGAELVGVGVSVSAEYFAKEHCGSLITLDPRAGLSPDQIEAVVRQIDVAVVGLQPEWVGALTGKVPVAYIDSLGFMWNDGHFDRYSNLRNVDAYIAQDCFGAVAKLQTRGIKNLVSVGAIIAPHPHAEIARRDGSIVHLGGLINIYNPGNGSFYASFALSLVDNLASEILASGEVEQYLPRSSFRWRRADNWEALQEFSRRKTVYTSPGLTALLEMAACNADVVPLPPQNYSQALIVNHIARLMPDDSVWAFLSERYSLAEGLEEQAAVEAVHVWNRHYAENEDFARRYRESVERNGGQPLPDHLRSRGNGCAACVDTIRRLLGLSHSHTS